MLNKGDEQKQQVGDGSTAVQATGNVVINNGLSYSEVRTVALDVFRSNFLDLAGEAKDIARQRAEEITDKFLQKLQEENPTGLTQSNNPDFQYGLFSVQRDFARAADTDLGDLLVDLLVDRTKHPKRDMTQIVLNECLLVAPKLINEQLSSLAIIFFFKYCTRTGMLDFRQLVNEFDKYVKPFAETAARSDSSYEHLVFAGCGTAQITVTKLEDILWREFQGLFDKGFPANELSGSSFYFNPIQQITGTCALDKKNIQVRAQNVPHLEEILDRFKISPEDSKKLREAFGKNRLTDEEIKAKCVDAMPYMSTLFDLWDNTKLKNMTLTSVGMGLAHANIKRVAGTFSDLSIWVN